MSVSSAAPRYPLELWRTGNCGSCGRHRQFDKLYKHGYMSKHDAYQWLGGILSVPAKQAHIAQLSLLSCNLVIREAKKQVNWYHMRKMAALQQTQEGDVKAS